MRKTAFVRIVGVIVLGFVTLCIIQFWNTPIFAATFTRSIETTVEPKDSKEVRVTQTQRLSWNNPQVFFPANKNFAYAYIFPVFENQLATLQQQVKNLTVQSSSGKILVFTTSMSDGAIQVKIPYYENLSDDNALGFTISYTTDLYILTEGGITELAYPGLSSDFKSKTSRDKEGYDEVTTYSLTFAVPSTFGELASVLPVPSTQKTVNKRTTIMYGIPQLVGNSVRIVLGKERTVKFVLSGSTYATNENSPDFVKDLLVNYVDVALPTQQVGTEFSNQTIYYSKIEPFPNKLWTDADGNLIARLPVSAAQGGKITIEGYALVRKGETVAGLPNVSINEIPATLGSYLKSEPMFWQVDHPNIKAAAEGIVSPNNLELEVLRQTLSFVIKQLAYPANVSESTLQRLGAVDALQKKVGVCMEYADLLLTLLRSKGIPTRAVYGDGIGSRVERKLKGIGHQWVGVWFPERGWVPVDPTWSEEGRELIGHDFDHLVWYVASESANKPSGFNCQSWDASSPCKDALSIETMPVDSLPAMDSLLTGMQLQEKVSALGDSESDSLFIRAAQSVVTYLGESQAGRVLLSKSGMLITFALLLYLVLVGIVALFSRLVRKTKRNPVQGEGTKSI